MSVLGLAKMVYDQVFKPEYIRYVDSQFLKSRTFQNTVLFCFNSLTKNGNILSRTALEVPLKTICHHNSVLETYTREAAKLTNDKDAIIKLPGGAGREIMVSLVNRASSHFAFGFLAEDLGIPVVKQKFIMALTRECDPRWRGQEKMRAIMVQKSTLNRIRTDPSVAEKFQSGRVHPNNLVRFATLQQMAVAANNIENFEQGAVTFVELAFPKSMNGAAIPLVGHGSSMEALEEDWGDLDKKKEEAPSSPDDAESSALTRH